VVRLFPEDEMGWSLLELAIAPPADGMCGGSPAPAVSGKLLGGGRLGDRGGRRGGDSRVAACADPARCGSRVGPPESIITRGRFGGKRSGRKGGRFSGLILPPSVEEWGYVGVDTSAHLTKAMAVLATRARLCDVPSTRSLGRKISSCGSPLAEHDARNFITFDLRRMPSSRGSICEIDPGRNLFKSLMKSLNVC